LEEPVRAGKGRFAFRQRGITLVEMLIVMALLGLMAGIVFPSVSSGIDSLRLISASDSIVTFLNGALNRAERRQQVMEVEISKAQNALWLRSTEPGFVRKLELPEGVVIRAILPAVPSDPEAPRLFVVYPGGTPPAVGVEIANRRAERRLVRVDPITGVSRVERLEEP